MRIHQEKNEQMGIKNRLKQIKDTKRLNLKEFSEVSGVSYRSLQNYLSGEREPNVAGLLSLCTHMGVNINWLLTGEGEMFIGSGGGEYLTPSEQTLLEDYRESNEQGKEAIEKTASALASKEASKNRQVAA